jgi:outer membrane protein
MACTALCSFAQILSAQAKVAVINLQKAVLESAEIKKASAAMEARYKPRQAEAQKIERELAGIQQNLQLESLRVLGGCGAGSGSDPGSYQSRV